MSTGLRYDFHVRIYYFNLFFLILLGGCSLGSNYEQPALQTKVPDAWHSNVVGAFNDSPLDVSQWWYRFDDPVLIALISESQKRNVSLKIAVSNLKQARSQYGVAASEYSPDITAVGRVEREQGSDNSPGLAAFPNAIAPVVNDFKIGLDASWEVDLWGRISKSVEAASASFEAELEQYRDTLITLRAEVASSYINVRVLQVKKLLAEIYIETLKDSLALIEEEYAQGIISRITMEQQRAMYDQGITVLPEYESLLTQECARLAVLIATDITHIQSMIVDPSTVPRANPKVAVGIPADVIRQRPDIRAAERALAAQAALVGAKIADLYPRLSLSGAFGYEATESNDLMQWSSRAYSVGPSFTWDIFNGDRIRSQIQLQEEKAEEAYLQWELVVLGAFAEVEVAMVSLIQSGKIQESMNDASQSAVTATLLTENLVQAGAQNRQSFLIAKQNSIEQQLKLVEQTGVVSQNLIALYKALGGDWGDGPGPDVKPIAHIRKKK